MVYRIQVESKEDGLASILVTNALHSSGDFYVLPSSIHEVLVLLDNGDMTVEELKEMVTSINGDVVDPADVLIDQVYHYDGRDYFEKHREVLTLRKAAKEAFDEYKQIHGKDVTIPKTKDLSAEYAVVLERKKKSYAEYKKMNSEKQEWFIAEKIVQAIMLEEERK